MFAGLGMDANAGNVGGDRMKKPSAKNIRRAMDLINLQLAKQIAKNITDKINALEAENAKLRKALKAEG